ncbi:hypothetical protein LZB54_07655 [Campylobacter jejuni]|uniref:hypothetical protein n=1 Tax=Campylobacter jejuni TaxID=197 RepID=UPI001F096777|nr:hypothetical protein [Campylobacter jejuni]MCH3842638.1 hypothetical protein [Campylobacter jejuni]MCH3868514.1 hypothetical protein [Campylobacter jejuni]MCH3875281.1 hypothetical protein [Campylobacter jejuni]
MRTWSLSGVFIGYMGYYLVRNNITLANWYPKKERGIYTAVWNISHNIGGGIVAPIVSLSGFALAALLGVSMANFNETYWHMNHFYTPAACAVILVFMRFMQLKEILKMKVWLILLKSMKCEGLKQKKSKL